MPIEELTPIDVSHACCFCGTTHRTALSVLRASQQEAPIPVADDVVRLPQCECGAVEFLAHSLPNETAHPSPGSYGHLHRLLVDHLHAVLDGATDGPAELAQWFPDGLRLAVPPPTNSATSPGGAQ
jgi:hypothetical protein